MTLKVIKDEELVVNKEYSLHYENIMRIFFPKESFSDYDALQRKFLVEIFTGSLCRTFFVGEGVLFLPLAGESLYKIIARKPGDDKGIKPNWKYYLIQYEKIE